MMETPDCESKDNEDCSDDDVNKGSDDVANDVPKNKTDTHSELCNKGHTIYSGTLVSVINIVITICICVTTVVILPEYHMNGFHLKENIFRMSDQLESLSTKLKTSCSQTIGPTKCENIYHDNYVLQKLNRRLKSELKKEKSKYEEENRKLKAELQNEKFKKVEPKEYDKLYDNYYVLDEENRKLKAELQKEKSEKEKENRKLKAELQKEKSKKENENRKLKAVLHKEKSEKDYIAGANKKHIQQNKNQEPLEVDYRTVSSTNNLYGWVFGDKSLTCGCTDKFSIDVKITLLYPEIPDNDKIFFEFGLITMIDSLKWDRPVIIVRGQRCLKDPGICLYVIDDTLSELEGTDFEQLSEYIRGQLTLELHKSFFVLMSNNRYIYSSDVLHISPEEKLWPVFKFYNTHLINISQTIISETKISFNRTTVDPHLFVSKDNYTISNFKLQPKLSLSGFDICIMPSEIVFFLISTMFSYILIFPDKFKDTIFQLLYVISFFISIFLCIPLLFYYIYMNWALHLLLVLSTLLGNLLYEVKYKIAKSRPLVYTTFTIIYSTYIAVFLEAVRKLFY